MNELKAKASSLSLREFAAWIKTKDGAYYTHLKDENNQVNRDIYLKLLGQDCYARYCEICQEAETAGLMGEDGQTWVERECLRRDMFPITWDVVFDCPNCGMVLTKLPDRCSVCLLDERLSRELRAIKEGDEETVRSCLTEWESKGVLSVRRDGPSSSRTPDRRPANLGYLPSLANKDGGTGTNDLQNLKGEMK